jgi:hypothetical protein
MSEQDRVRTIRKFLDLRGCGSALLVKNDALIVRHVAKILPTMPILRLQQFPVFQDSNHILLSL